MAHTPSGLEQQFYQFVFGVGIVVGPVFAAAKAALKTMEETRALYGKPNPYISVFKAFMYFVIVTIIFTAIYEILGVTVFQGGTHPMEYARMFWKGVGNTIKTL